ncbi:type II secretion system protein [Succinimonas sp.]|uniref:type II secretion system protein n=1 Tax=Succinimonas sp. TaxID=1936151 RepID=UPI003864C944
MRKQNGFTLIELVVVIVILGILAATAAPKFMDLQKDARISAVNGLAGAIKSSVSMTFSKAILAGKDKTESGSYICNSGAATAECTSSSADAVELVLGRPAATAAGIINAVDIDATLSGAEGAVGEWIYNPISTPSGIAIWQSASTAVTGASAGCGLIYEAAKKTTSGSSTTITPPKVTVVDKDC